MVVSERFIVMYCTVTDTKTNKGYLADNPTWAKKFAKLLNQLDEEINILKATNEEMEDYLARLEEGGV
jgi:hypothetical protein